MADRIVTACALKDISQELSDAKRATRLVGGGEPREYRFTLPEEMDERSVVVIPKVAPTPSGYPRRVGLAKSRPLGSSAGRPQDPFSYE